jgi:hypothetical protein
VRRDTANAPGSGEIELARSRTASLEPWLQLQQEERQGRGDIGRQECVGQRPQ